MVSSREAPVYLLTGSEQFLKEENLTRIKSALLDAASRDFNFNVFYAGSCAVKKILECASTAPFLGSKRVVLVHRIEDFSASEEKLILSYVKVPNKVSVLILETSESNLKQRFFAEICRHARLIRCDPLKGRELVIWLKRQVAAKGKKIEEAALQLLLDTSRLSLQALAFSLDNLILYIGQKETITCADVEKLTGSDDMASSAFELYDAVIAGEKEKSFEVLESLWRDGVSFSQILGALSYKFILNRNRISSGRLKGYLLDLQNTDRDIKTSRQGQKIALELLTARLLNLG
ncbi:MAG: DNA polymerase III subunit delta [Candidatus Omnitrophota bacterium]|nr:MAG: DNA polymerase III subunit delta [Candidatus Omnitrophota bacterium]